MAILKDLIVHGSSRFLNKIYASEIQTPLIKAEAGIIKKLKADDATIVGLLDVQGQLHTSSWTNSNIATIDGSFYITPTIESSQGTVGNISTSTLNFSRKSGSDDFATVSSLYLGNDTSITWPRYSKILITGQILLNGEWIPLGTLLGQLNAAATAASIKVYNITDNKNRQSSILVTLANSGITSTTYRNLKISLYQRANGASSFYPLGIYMTATGINGKTFLDIYGGVELLNSNINNSNNYGGFADPNVRIGNLQGLPSVGGQTPKGWGIYTDNGYFKGIIAADQGYIGSGSKYWVIANEEDVVSRSYIYNGTNSVTSTTEGVYLGTDGIRNYKDNTHNVTIKDGVITALGVNLTGTINATAGNIGGASITGGTLTVPAAYISGQLTAATIDASKISTGDISSDRITTNVLTALQAKLTSLNTNNLSAITANLGTITTGVIKHDTVGGTNGIWLSADTDTSSNVTVGESTARKDWRLLVNNKFGVTKTGDLYASSANISGNITATSGTIGGIQIDNSGKLWITDANISGTISSNHIDVSSISIGSLSGASNYAQKSYVDDAVNDIEIGGRNLIWNSNFQLPINGNWANWGLASTTREVVTINGENWIHIVTTANAFQGYQQSQTNRNGFGQIQAEDKIIFSYDAYSKIEGQKGCIGIHWRDSNDTNISQSWTSFDLTTTKKRYITPVFTVPTNAVGFNIMIGQNIAAAQEIWITNIKGEKGNKATDWTPAPEDTQESINNTAKTATSYITYINANDGIKVHNAQDTLNYLQLNSTAISMFRAKDDGTGSDEVLKIDNTGIRIGKNEGPHFSLTNDKLIGYGDIGNVYFEVGKGDNTTIQLFYGNGERTSFEIGPLFKTIYYVKKNDVDLISGTDYEIHVTAVRYNIYFKIEPTLNSTISVTYKDFYKSFIYTISSSSSGDITVTSQQGPWGTATVITIQTHKSYEAESIYYKKSGTNYWQRWELEAEEESGTYKYSFYLGEKINSGDQVKLNYSTEEHTDLTPDTVTESYTWDATHQNSTLLTVPSASQILSVSINDTVLIENEDYTLDGLLKYGYLIFYNAPAVNEKIEIKFLPEEYNFEYQPTYFNFSNTNLENSVKGIGAASFGSENVNKGIFCFAEGAGNIVTGYASHVEGHNNIAAGSHSHVGGSNSLTLGQNTFAYGDNLQATYLNSAAFGFYNSPENQLFSIGKGGYENAFSINKDGNIQMGGRLLAGTTYTNNRPLFTFDTLIWQGQSIPKNGSWTKTGYQLTRKPGYKAIGIAGIGIYDGAGGANANWCVPMRCYVWSTSPYDLLDVYIWNQNTTSATSNTYIYIKILFIADTVF